MSIEVVCNTPEDVSKDVKMIIPMFTLYNTEHWCRAIRKSATK